MVAFMSSPRGWGEPTWGETPGPTSPAQPAPGPISGTPTTPTGGLQPVGQLMDEVIAAIRWAPRVTWAFGGTIVGVLTLVQGALAAGLGLRRYVETLHPGDLADIDSQLSMIAASAVVSVLAWVTGLLASALCAGVAAVVVGHFRRAGDDRATTSPPSAGTVWAELRPRVGGALGLALLLAFTIAALAAVPLVWLVALAASQAWLLAFGGGVLLLLGVAVAAFWLLPVLAVALPEHVTPSGGAGTGGAIGRSARLVRGNRWRLVGVWLLTSIVLALANGAVSTPFGWLSTMLTGVGDGTWTAVAWILGSAVSAAVTAPIGALVLALVHTDLRR